MYIPKLIFVLSVYVIHCICEMTQFTFGLAFLKTYKTMAYYWLHKTYLG